MELSEMTAGRRVRIARTIDLFPIGPFEAGITGTVEMAAGDGSSAPCRRVILDQHFWELSHWDNRLHVWGPDVPECTAEDFEPLD